MSVTAQAWGLIAVRWGGRPSGGGRIKWAKPIRPRVRRRSRRTRTTTKPVGAGRGGEAGEAPEQIRISKTRWSHRVLGALICSSVARLSDNKIYTVNRADLRRLAQTLFPAGDTQDQRINCDDFFHTASAARNARNDLTKMRRSGSNTTLARHRLTHRAKKLDEKTGRKKAPGFACQPCTAYRARTVGTQKLSGKTGSDMEDRRTGGGQSRKATDFARHSAFRVPAPAGGEAQCC